MWVTPSRAEALALVSRLLERDDIGQVPIPPEAKRYARMRSGILSRRGGQAKVQLYIDQVAATTNQQRQKQGFKNYDGSVYTGKRAKAKEPKLEAEGAKDWLRKHGIVRSRNIQVDRDPSNEAWFRIPVFDRGRRMWNMLKPGTNPKHDMKERVQWLARHRAGYKPGDIFVTPLGNFLVTDSLGIKEV